jgi:hypothetical protein
LEQWPAGELAGSDVATGAELGEDLGLVALVCLGDGGVAAEVPPQLIGADARWA